MPPNHAAGTKWTPPASEQRMPEKIPRSTAVVVLAAGLGKRLRSDLPKVLHPLCGRPALWHVLQAARSIRPARIVVVVHNQAGLVREHVESWGIRPAPVFVEQGIPLGTGHAVMAAEDAIGDATEVLVMSGDEPLHTADSLKELLRAHRKAKAAATLVTTQLPDASGYGRVIRSGDELVRIAEERDASPAERAITEVATMAYAFRREALFDALPLVGTDNRQREYYLPDTLRILKSKGERIGVMAVDFGGVVGINNRAELAAVTAVMRRRINAGHMAGGVTLIDPEQTYIDADVRVGRDTVVHPMTFLHSGSRIGEECEIGPATRIQDSVVGDRSVVRFSEVSGSRIGREVDVGPYTYIRPGTVLDDGSKAGAYVEVKASRVGKGSKVPHLSYIGDTTIGKATNVGAATVTVNYDGWDKHRTVIGDDVRIGSDTMLVAPVTVGDRAMTGAGSVISKDVPAGALAIERSEQRTIEGYRDRKEAGRQADSRSKDRATGKKRKRKSREG